MYPLPGCSLLTADKRRTYTRRLSALSQRDGAFFLSCIGHSSPGRGSGPASASSSRPRTKYASTAHRMTVALSPSSISSRTRIARIRRSSRSVSAGSSRRRDRGGPVPPGPAGPWGGKGPCPIGRPGPCDGGGSSRTGPSGPVGLIGPWEGNGAPSRGMPAGLCGLFPGGFGNGPKGDAGFPG